MADKKEFIPHWCDICMKRKTMFPTSDDGIRHALIQQPETLNDIKKICGYAKKHTCKKHWNEYKQCSKCPGCGIRGGYYYVDNSDDHMETWPDRLRWWANLCPMCKESIPKYNLDDY
jgi:hypothetical protein